MMDKYERRRLRLKTLMDERCHGKPAELARAIQRDLSYVTRMLYPDGKPGKKRISDNMMEIIEAAFGLPTGWLNQSSANGDAEHSGSLDNDIAHAIASLTPERKAYYLDLIRADLDATAAAAENLSPERLRQILAKKTRAPK